MTAEAAAAPQRRVRAVALDCDGVMFDTARTNRAYYNHLLSRFGRPPLDDEQFAHAQTHTVFETIDHLFGGDAAVVEAVLRYRRGLSYDAFIGYMEMEPRLVELLRHLRGRYLTAVATNRTDTMRPILSHFSIDRYFDLVVTALDVERPKPHPDVIDAVLGAFGLKPDQLLYIGDSFLDEAAAGAAGVHFAAFGNAALNAVHHIDSLWEVTGILAHLNGTATAPRGARG